MLPTSRVHLLTGVPLSNNYVNTLSFTTVSEQYNYFYSKRNKNHTDCNYIREGMSLKVEGSYDSLLNVNYMMYQNEEYGNKWFYAFITSKEYINPNVTLIHMEIDVFQTWYFDYNIKPCFVEREHTEQYNGASPIINTVDEGIDYGSEMDTVYFHEFQPHNGLFWLVVVSKSAMHTEDNKPIASVIGVPQPLSYYVLPFKLDGGGVNVNTNNGTSIPGQQGVQDVLNAMYANDNAVNNIVSLYVTDNTGLAFTYDGSTVNFPSGSGQVVNGVTVNSGENSFAVAYVEKVESFTTLSVTLNQDKYLGCTRYEQSKLLMYPYTQAFIQDFKGNTFPIRLEHINGNTLSLDLRGSLGLSNKTSVSVKNYNVNGSVNNKDDFEHGFINSDPQDVPVITDQLAAYLQGNRNSLNNQKSQMQFNAIMDIGRGAAATGSGIATGGAAGGISAGSELVGTIGNSYYGIEALNAKQKDIANIPPNLSQQGSNTAFSFGNGFTGYFLVKKQIKPEWATRLNEYFKMYGYKVNRVKQPHFRNRPSWNYIKTQGCNIVGNMPHDHMLKIQAIYDSGVTVWHGDWVGEYDRAN